MRVTEKCPRCGDPIGEVVVWRFPVPGLVIEHPECMTCAADAIPADDATPEPCHTCGRSVIDLRGCEFAACSPECRDAEWKRRRSPARPRQVTACPWCGESLEGRKWNASYCCDEHRALYLWWTVDKPPLDRTGCVICGGSLAHRRHRDAMYCGKNCAQRAYKRRQRAKETAGS